MEEQKPIQQLNDIHAMMERSSRFISLSGLSGVSAGIFALAGAAFAYCYMDLGQLHFSKTLYEDLPIRSSYRDFLILATDALIVLALTLFFGVYFTTRKARLKGLKVWDHTARRLLINLFLPLITGGIFCLILVYYHIVFMIAPSMLVFYGLSLLNAGKYTYDELRVLGICEIILGLIAAVLPGFGLIFWATGFGLLHILYGLIMYLRYDRTN